MEVKPRSTPSPSPVEAVVASARFQVLFGQLNQESGANASVSFLIQTICYAVALQHYLIKITLFWLKLEKTTEQSQNR